jgi:lipopolysaccharide assembly outer membrane protein LptD (OstA)
LTPQIGFSGAKGFSYTQSYYWIVKRNMDATFTLDFFSAKGLGSGLEYRYLLSGGVGGQLNLYYFNYMKGSETPSTAYLFRFKHNQPLPLKFNLVTDVDYSSSFSFLREFDNDFKRAVVSNRSSQAYISKAWSYFNFNARVTRFETYFIEREEGDRSIINYNLPTISFSSYKMKLFSPLYFSFSSSFSRWEYGWESWYKAGTQRRSQNLNFNPELSFPFTALPWLTFNSSFSAHLNYYFQSYAPGTNSIVSEPLFRTNYEANVELVGPVFYKIYYGSQGVARLKHIMEPYLSFRYESPVDDSERIITPWIFYRNEFIQYGLTNRFLVKEEEMPREVFALNISQTFYLSPEDSPMQLYQVDNKIPEFSDIGANLRFYPARKYSLDASVAFNPYYRTFSSLRLGASVGAPDDPAFLRVNWYKSINPYQYETWWDRHQIGFSGGLKIPRLSLDTLAEVDFNIQERKLLYTGLSFIYHYQCLDFKGELKIFYFREKPETQFRISIGLGNIGGTSDFFGGLLF